MIQNLFFILFYFISEFHLICYFPKKNKIMLLYVLLSVKNDTNFFMQSLHNIQIDLFPSIQIRSSSGTITNIAQYYSRGYVKFYVNLMVGRRFNLYANSMWIGIWIFCGQIWYVKTGIKDWRKRKFKYWKFILVDFFLKMSPTYNFFFFFCQRDQ